MSRGAGLACRVMAIAALCGPLLQPASAADEGWPPACKRNYYTCRGSNGYEGVPACCSKLTAVCGQGSGGEPLCQPSPCGADLNPCVVNSTRCIVTDSYQALCISGGCLCLRAPPPLPVQTLRYCCLPPPLKPWRCDADCADDNDCPGRQLCVEGQCVAHPCAAATCPASRPNCVQTGGGRVCLPREVGFTGLASDGRSAGCFLVRRLTWRAALLPQQRIALPPPSFQPAATTARARSTSSAGRGASAAPTPARASPAPPACSACAVPALRRNASKVSQPGAAALCQRRAFQLLFLTTLTHTHPHSSLAVSGMDTCVPACTSGHTCTPNALGQRSCQPASTCAPSCGHGFACRKVAGRWTCVQRTCVPACSAAGYECRKMAGRWRCVRNARRPRRPRRRSPPARRRALQAA